MSEKRTKVGVIRPFACSECLHYMDKPLKGHTVVCSKEGVRGGAVAPTCFTPNVSTLVGSSDQLVAIATMMQTFDRKQLRTLYGLMATKPKQKLVFGSTVYFRVVGGDYVSNYLSGHIVGTTSRREIIVMGDPDSRKRGKPYVAYFDSMDDLLTSKEWKIKRKELSAQGKLEDPKLPLKKRRPAITVDYEPPTIDSSFEKARKAKRVVAVDKRLKSQGLGKAERFVITGKGK